MSQWTHSLPAKVGALLLTFLFICLAGGACVGIVCAWNMQIYDGANAYPVDAAAAEQYDISCYFSSDICRSTAFEAAHRAMRMLKNGRAAQKIDQELSLQSTNLHLAIFDEQGKLLSATDQAVWLAAEHNLRWIDTDGLAGYLRAQPPNQADLSEEGTEPAAPDHQAADQLAETLIPRGTVLLTIIDRLEEDSRLFAMLPSHMTVQDTFAQQERDYVLLYPLRWVFPIVVTVSAIAGLLCIIFLCCAAGHRRDSSVVQLNYLDRIPFDLFLTAIGAGEVFLLIVASGFLPLERLGDIISFAATCVLILLLALITLLTFCTRVKVGKLWKNTLVYGVLHLCFRMLRGIIRGIESFLLSLPMIWRTLLVGLGLVLVNLFIANPRTTRAFFLLILLGCGIVAFICLAVYQMQALKRAGQALSEGNFDEKLSTRRMLPDLRQHGENLNSLGEGMSMAVEQRMRSERMKTELITNVSHDIKTPLTSIINYVDLLQKDPAPEQRAQYLSVLDRQAKRLKKLTEDLVEASKASTGNLTVNLKPIDLHEFLNQAIGEYEDRLSSAGLTLVANISGEGLSAMADGRHLWRILDNLLNNACKYAQPQTRVYLDAAAERNDVVITMKNISKEALNVSPDELTERFVRGDSSRNTDGSGLGLNIAKSLAELQYGDFTIEIDGDLFKARLTLPRCDLPPKEALIL